MAGQKNPRRQRLLNRLHAVRPTSQTFDPPETQHSPLPSQDTPSVTDADDILTCQKDEFPRVTRQLVDRALGIANPPHIADELNELVALQRSITTNVLQRVLDFRQVDGANAPAPRQLQVNVLQRMVFAGLDTLLVVRTGFGKSVIFQSWMTMLDKTSIIIVPLNGLGDQIYDDFLEIPGANPIVLSNETKQRHVNIYNELLNGNSKGRYTHIITSPEQAVSPEFRKLLRNPYFRQNVGSVVIDEAHCIVMWSTFRSEYAKLYTLQSLLPTSTVIFACTATLTPSLQRLVVRDAGFGRLRPWDPERNVIRGSVDRPEIGLVVTKLPSRNSMKELLRTLGPALEPLDGIERADISRRTTIPGPMTVIFANTRNKVAEICRMLRDVLRRHGYTQRAVATSITTYTSRTSKRDRDIRRNEMKKLKSGIRILVATTAFGMGLDIPHIEVVYQFEAVLPDIATQDASDLIPCEIWQRGGRCARGNHAQGLFIIMLQHDIESREQKIEKKRMQLLSKSKTKDSPATKRQGSTQSISTTHSRRNSQTADSIGRYDDTEAGMNPGQDADPQEPDDTVDGITAAVQASEIPGSDIQTKELLGPRFSYATLLGAVCYRKYFLSHLGEDGCSPELKDSPAPAERCCSKCNLALLPEVWYPSEVPDSKVETAKPGEKELPGVALPFIKEWADDEMNRELDALCGSGCRNMIHQLGGEFLVPHGVQNRLAKEMYTVALQGPIQFKKGDINNSTILQELGFDEAGVRRFVTWIRKNEPAILEKYGAVNGRQPLNRNTTTSNNVIHKSVSQTNTQVLESRSVESTPSHTSIQRMDSIASIATIRPSIQSQVSQFCRQALQLNMRNGTTGAVSQPSGLRFESIVGEGTSQQPQAIEDQGSEDVPSVRRSGRAQTPSLALRELLHEQAETNQRMRERATTVDNPSPTRQKSKRRRRQKS